jgi:hypothetical protein
MFSFSVWATKTYRNYFDGPSTNLPVAFVWAFGFVLDRRAGLRLHHSGYSRGIPPKAHRKNRPERVYLRSSTQPNPVRWHPVPLGPDAVSYG